MPALPARWYASPDGVIYRKTRCEGCGAPIWHANGHQALGHVSLAPHVLAFCHLIRQAVQEQLEAWLDRDRT
jgi:hypothetical protein